MKNHGNLYWEISLAFSHRPADTQFCEHTRIKVSSYDYNDVFHRAKALYDALTAAGGILLNFAQYLREDDSAENDSAQPEADSLGGNNPENAGEAAADDQATDK